MSGGGSPAARLVDLPSRRLAIVRATVDARGMAQAQRAARAAFAAAGLGAAPRLTLWRRRPDDQFDYAPGLALAGDADPPAPIERLDLPAGRAVHLVYRGGYEGLGEAWGKLFGACAALGVAPAGWNLELYAAEGEPPGADLYAALA